MGNLLSSVPPTPATAPQGFTANGLFSSSRGPSGLVLVLSPGLASSILEVIKVPRVASPEVPHTLSFLFYTTFRKQDLVYYSLSPGIRKGVGRHGGEGEAEWKRSVPLLGLELQGRRCCPWLFFMDSSGANSFFFLQRCIFLSMLAPELPTPLQESFY